MIIPKYAFFSVTFKLGFKIVNLICRKYAIRDPGSGLGFLLPSGPKEGWPDLVLVNQIKTG